MRNTVAAYNQYLRNYSPARFDADAQKAIEDIEWAKAKVSTDDAWAVNSYLADNPKGVHAVEGLKLQDQIDWKNSQTSNTVAAYKRYLEKHKDSANVSLATTALETAVVADKKRLAETMSKANAGNAEASFELSRRYDSGDGVDKDPKESVKWLTKAAEAGHVNAQYNLGILYENGDTVRKDVRQAADWYKKAADQGLADAQFSIGRLYVDGSGGTKDMTAAARYVDKAAEQGLHQAQYTLGMFYLNGEGGLNSKVDGLAWLMVASASGNSDIVYYSNKAQRQYGPAEITPAKKLAAEIAARIEESRIHRPDYKPPETLYKAAGEGNITVMKRLLDSGTDVNAKDKNGSHALTWALAGNHREAALFLLENGAAANLIDDDDDATPLLYAAGQGDAELVALLLKKNAPANTPNDRGETPLLRASSGGFIDVVAALVEHGADVNLSDDQYCSPMLAAASAGHAEVVEYLLGKNADPNIVAKYNQPPRSALLAAALNGHDKVIHILLKNHARDSWLSDVPGFNPKELDLKLFNEGKDGTVNIGGLPFFLGAHSVSRPWKAPEPRNSTGGTLFRWQSSKSNSPVGIIVIQDSRGNSTLATLQMPCYMGQGAISYPDGISVIAPDGPFVEVRVEWLTAPTAEHCTVTITRLNDTINAELDKDGKCAIVLKKVVLNEPITVRFLAGATVRKEIDFDCVLRSATEHGAFYPCNLGK